MMATSYFRLLHLTYTNPGILHQEPAPNERRDDTTKDETDDVERGAAGNHTYITPVLQLSIPTLPPPQLEDFHFKEAFVCDEDGRPKWCDKCNIWRPDRAHHNRETDRCVRRLDHYCPWVGGLVAERNMKFFIQFNSYTVLYCIHCLVIMATYLSEVPGPGPQPIGTWIPVLFFGVFFVLITLGTAETAILLICMNVTTIENLKQKTMVWQLAVRLSDEEAAIAERKGLRTFKPFDAANDANDDPFSGSSSNNGGKSNPSFAILKSKPGANPFDLGVMENWRQTMGHNVLDWFLPIKMSPCCSQRHEAGDPVFGADLDAMKADAGLITLTEKQQRKIGRLAKRKQRFPYWLAGAGAPLKMWKSYWEWRKQNR